MAFYFRLALEFGCPVRELLERVSSPELSLWMAFYANDPWGEKRADLRSAIVASTVANSISGGRHRVSDFLPVFERRQQTWQEIQSYFVALSKRQHGQ